MGYQPCIIYLNGEYWGLYGIREKIDEHYVESNHGIDSKKVDLLNKDGALSGSEDHFLESYDLIMNSNINDPGFIEMFSSRFDFNNYIDYFIFQTYIQNMDWLGIAWGLNNIKLWRPDSMEENGGMYSTTQMPLLVILDRTSMRTISIMRAILVFQIHAQIFNRALNNNDFKCQFTNRYDDLINTTFQTQISTL